MRSEPLFDISDLDLNHVAHDIEEIRTINPHRHEFEMIDSILRFSDEPLGAVAIKRVREDQWWCRGHLPGDPVFPGVLMVEGAAQASSFCFHKTFGKLDDKFFGFGGLEDIRFRGMVRPGDDIILMVRAIVCRVRRAKFDFQAYVNNNLVAEGVVIGVTVPKAETATS